MALSTIAAMAADYSLQTRIIASAASHGVATPQQWYADHVWALCSTQAWIDAYSYAQGQRPLDIVAVTGAGLAAAQAATNAANYDVAVTVAPKAAIGASDNVITDALIDAAVAAIVTPASP